MQLPTYSEWYVTCRISRRTNATVIKDVSLVIEGETTAEAAMARAKRIMEGDEDWNVLTLTCKPYRYGKPAGPPPPVVAPALPPPRPEEPEPAWWEVYGPLIKHPETIDIGELMP